MRLLKFQEDYADEFDVYGLELISDEEYKRWQLLAKYAKEEDIEWYFGTNEEIFIPVKSFVNSVLNAPEVSDSFVEELRKNVLLGNSFGSSPLEVVYEHILYNSMSEEERNEILAES